MKIGIVSPYYMHLSGGVQNLILDLQAYLKDKGHQALIIAPRPRSEENLAQTPTDILLLGISMEVNFKNPFHTTFPIAREDRETITAFLAEHNFDLLNIHEPWMPFLPFQILQEARCPIVGTAHARWPRSLFNKSLEKIRMPYFKSVLKQVDQMTAVSAVAARNITDTDPEYPFQIIPNGLDYTGLKKQMETAINSRQAPYMLYLNRLEKRKGPKLLLRAYKIYVDRMQTRALPLIIAGRGPQKKSLEAYAAYNNLSHLVRFEGYVSHERKIALMANARLYISPAPYGESFGIVLLEAMTAGLPIVAGNNQGYQNILHDEGSKSLVNPYKKKYFARRLEILAHRKPDRLAWQNWAKKEIHQYDFPKIGCQYEDCFIKTAAILDKVSQKRGS